MFTKTYIYLCVGNAHTLHRFLCMCVDMLEKNSIAPNFCFNVFKLWAYLLFSLCMAFFFLFIFFSVCSPIWSSNDIQKDVLFAYIHEYLKATVCKKNCFAHRYFIENNIHIILRIVEHFSSQHKTFFKSDTQIFGRILPFILCASHIQNQQKLLNRL